MGYDMSMIEGATDAEQAAIAVAEELFRDAVKERDKYERGSAEYDAAQAEVVRASEEWDEVPSDYFRLNIWGMGRCRGFMLERGMAYEAPCPSFPSFTWPAQEDFEHTDEFEAAEMAAYDEYNELIKPTLEHHPEGGDGIPTYKLGSNDGWHVTEAECAAAVAAARASDLPDPSVVEDGLEATVQWWDGWVDYLDRASQRGGFHVH